MAKRNDLEAKLKLNLIDIEEKSHHVRCLSMRNCDVSTHSVVDKLKSLKDTQKYVGKNGKMIHEQL